MVQRPAEGWTNRPLSCKLCGGHSVNIYPQRENQCEQRRRKCFMMQAVNENTALFLNPFLTVGEDWTLGGGTLQRKKNGNYLVFPALYRKCDLDVVLLLKKKSLNLLFNTGMTVLEIT